MKWYGESRIVKLRPVIKEYEAFIGVLIEERVVYANVLEFQNGSLSIE